MKKSIAISAVLLSITMSDASAEIQPNSKYFFIDNYSYLDSNGNANMYRVVGFAQPPIPQISPKLFLLPAISITKNGIKFYGENGEEFNPSNFPERGVQAIGLKASIATSLPTAEQLPAIAAALEGTSVPAFLPPPLKNPDGSVPIFPPARSNSDYVKAIEDDTRAYDTNVARQGELAARYKDYQPQMAVLNELSIALIMDNDVLVSRRFRGSSILSAPTLPELTLSAPTEYQRNRIANGDFELLVAYRFLDTQTSSIQATFDVNRTINHFIEETRTAITQKKSSGFQIFHIGARRSTITQSLNEQVNTSAKDIEKQGTIVVMNDATDDMVRQFEESFFPEITKDEVIERHLKAAEEARAAGKPELAKVHEDYVASLRGNDQMKEVDAIAAAAALASGNYAAFIANGVRASSSNDIRSDSFRRVITLNVATEAHKEWLSARTMRVQRETSVPVFFEQAREFRPRIGLCEAMAVGYQAVMAMNTGPTQVNDEGMLLTCLQASGPLARAGLRPGMIVMSIDGKRITSTQQLYDFLDEHEPGESVQVRVLMPLQNMPFFTVKRFDVKLLRGALRS